LDRGLAQADANGSDHPEIDAVAYVEHTMRDTVRKLGGTTMSLIERAKAQNAKANR